MAPYAPSFRQRTSGLPEQIAQCVQTFRLALVVRWEQYIFVRNLSTGTWNVGLSNVEKRRLEKLFDMESGYVSPEARIAVKL